MTGGRFYLLRVYGEMKRLLRGHFRWTLATTRHIYFTPTLRRWSGERRAGQDWISSVVDPEEEC